MGDISKSRHRKSLEYALKVLFNEKYNKYIKSIYLFGSCARVEQRESSDVDLFVFITENMERRLYHELRSNISPEEENLPSVDLHCSKSNRFSDTNCFNNNLIKESKLLWKRD